MLEGGYVHSQYAKGVIQEGSFHKCKKTLEGRSRSMRKGKILLILVLVITALFVASCVRQPVIPGVPANLRATALVGVVGVELRWDAVAGAASYDVTIEKLAASGSRETFGPYNTTNTYYLATRDVLGAGDFDWNVSAKNVAGSSNPAAGLEFNLPAVPDPDPVYGLELTLEERPDQGSLIPTIYIYGGGVASAKREESCTRQFNYLLGLLQYVELLLGEARDDMAVQFMVQEVGGGVALRWPDSDTEFLLDEEGELEFYVNDLGDNPDDELEEGEYYLWARAAWDNSIESTKVRFNISELAGQLESEIVLMDEEEEKEFEDKVCPTSTEVTLVYKVSIEGGELFDGLRYSFQVGSEAEGELVDMSGEFADETEFSTKVTFSTECTKYATLTVDGTITTVYWDDEEATEVTEDVLLTGILEDGILFVLDMADPTAMVTVEPADAVSAPASITTATLTFLASDTKCLQPYAEKIAFEILVDKGAGNWEAEFAYGVVETILGEDSVWDNEMTINGTYSATKTTTDNATITLVFDIQELDLATVTATMTVHDCCCEECMLEGPCVGCGVGGNITHETEVMSAFVVDNVFFSEMLELDEVLAFDGFLGEEGATPTIPASPAYATLTIVLADANWDATKWESTQWALGPNTVVPVVQATELISEVCSGYATKTQVTLVATMTASGVATEVELTLTGTAVDLAGNRFVISQNFLFDTIPPTLTHFAAFRDQIVNRSWIEFAFDQEPNAENTKLALTVSASGTFLYDLTKDASPITGQENAYRLLTGITLPFNTEITLGATATDLAGNVGFSTKAATVSLSSPR